LPNVPGGALEAVTTRDGVLLIVHNDSTAPKQRYSIAVSYSFDDGKTFKTKTVEAEPPAGRFDYPSLLQNRDGNFELTYSWYLQTIRHVTFNAEWLFSD